VAGAPPEVAVGVLGNLEVHVDGTPVAIGQARRKAVPAVLLVEANGVVPADRLIDRVWGEEPPSRARSVLRTHLSKLRQALDRTGITFTWHDTGYLLTIDPGSVDLHRFRRLLVQARGAGGPRCRRSRPDRLGVGLRQARGRAAGADHVGCRTPAGRTRGRTGGACAVPVRPPCRRAGALPAHPAAAGRGVGADPGPALRELHQRVVTADPARDVPPTEPARSVPRQLPAPPPSFVGRGDELDRLDSALDASATVVISAIAGAGGTGKTWPALHWAHRNADRFPDGQLFVDLHGFGPDTEPLDPATAVRGFLDALRAVLTTWLGPPS